MNTISKSHTKIQVKIQDNLLTILNEDKQEALNTICQCGISDKILSTGYGAAYLVFLVKRNH